MSRIFISYKRVDKDKVFRIKEQIESALGEKCWIDLDGIESDAQFKNVIIKAINDCEVVLFMYSKAHSKIADFEKDWTVRELNFASKKNKRIVFINLDGSSLTDAFEFDYGAKQQVDGQKTEQINKLCRDLRNWLKIQTVQVVSDLQNDKTQISSNGSLSYSNYLYQWSKCLNKKVIFALSLVLAVICGGWFFSQYMSYPVDDYQAPDTLNIDGVRFVMQPIQRTDSAESFYISQTEVTQALWSVVMGNNPSEQIGDSIPVHCVSWYDCIDFCLRLSEKTGLSFSLPTKEQWMYAALADDTLKYCGSDSIDEVAWYTDNSHYMKCDVALKKPNAWGLYDMSGNVCEWCLDSLPQSSLMRVIMGGGHSSSTFENEVSHVDYDYAINYQDQNHMDNGLRIVMRSKLSEQSNTAHIQSLIRILAKKSIDENRYNSLPHGERSNHKWVDLGLPSGTKWATSNIGGEDGHDYGDYFAWGEITNCNDKASEGSYDWCDLKYRVKDKSQLRFSKYVLVPEYGNVDGKNELELSDDAAHVVWGKGWRIPSNMQIDELYNTCTWVWSTLFGHHGYKVIGQNGNSIFLPAAGKGGWTDYVGISGYYWSRSLYSESDERSFGAHALTFMTLNHENNRRNDGVRPEFWTNRYCTLRIRPVLEY